MLVSSILINESQHDFKRESYSIKRMWNRADNGLKIAGIRSLKVKFNIFFLLKRKLI
jgi:hypothetical protein